MHTIRHRFAAGVLISAAMGCALPQTREDLAGTYVMSKTWAADTLDLGANGHYSRSYTDPPNARVVDTGRWFLSKDRKLVALLEYPKRWAFVHDLMGDTTNGEVLKRPSTLALTVERGRFGGFRLGWHSNFGWWYRRVMPK